MDRILWQHRRIAVGSFLCGLVLIASGCTSGLATAMYLLGANDIQAEYDGLKKKRVAVVCRPLVDLQYRSSNAAKDIGRELGRLLEQNVRKIDVVDHRKVAEWLDENTWDEYAEVGRAVDADMVVGVDLEHFTIFESQTLYQGKANATIRVYDCKTGELAFERTLPQVLYPPNTAIATSDKQESQFRREFIRVVADQVGRLFYNHDPYSDYATDATVVN